MLAAVAASAVAILTPCLVFKNFQDHVWSIKYRQKEKLTTQFDRKPQDESFESN
jgi:hypothetical protein